MRMTIHTGGETVTIASLSMTQSVNEEGTGGRNIR